MSWCFPRRRSPRRGASVRRSASRRGSGFRGWPGRPQRRCGGADVGSDVPWPAAGCGCQLPGPVVRMTADSHVVRHHAERPVEALLRLRRCERVDAQNVGVDEAGYAHLPESCGGCRQVAVQLEEQIGRLPIVADALSRLSRSTWTSVILLYRPRLWGVGDLRRWPPRRESRSPSTTSAPVCAAVAGDGPEHTAPAQERDGPRSNERVRAPVARPRQRQRLLRPDYSDPLIAARIPKYPVRRMAALEVPRHDQPSAGSG